MTATRLQRYLATLAHAGLTAQTRDRRYTMGPGIHALSAISTAASGLTARALDLLPRLSDLKSLIALGIVWRRQVTYLYYSVPDHDLAQAIGRTRGYPAEHSAIGQVLLAAREDEALASEFPDKIEKLMSVIGGVRQRGYAEIDQPASGHLSLAVPVGAPPVAALAVSGPVRSRKAHVLARMREVAAQLSADDPKE